MSLGICCRYLSISNNTTCHHTCFDRFAVSFVPAEACEHIINVSFNKSGVPGCPIHVQVSGNASGPQVSLNGPGPINEPNSLIITHPGGRLDDVEVNVEGELRRC